MMRLLEVL